MPSGVYERTEECRKSLSKSHLGQVAWNKGKKTGLIPWNKGKTGIYSEETLKRMGLANLGKYLSEDHKRKIGLTGLGRRNTKETIKKMKLAHLRENLSDKTLKKMSRAQSGENNPMFGKHCSEEHKRKISKANKRLILPQHFKKGRIPWNKDKKGCFTKEILKRILYRRAPSSLEEKFQSIVDKYNLPYKYVGDGSFIIGRYNPDFINTNSEKIAVEVYARYYKKRNNKSIEDWKIQRAKVFRQYGWQVMYFNEIEVNEEDILNKLNEVK